MRQEDDMDGLQKNQAVVVNQNEAAFLEAGNKLHRRVWSLHKLNTEKYSYFGL